MSIHLFRPLSLLDSGLINLDNLSESSKYPIKTTGQLFSSYDIDLNRASKNFPEYTALCESTCCGIPSFALDPYVRPSYFALLSDVVAPRSKFSQRHVIIWDQCFISDNFGSKRTFNWLIRYFPHIIGYSGALNSISVEINFDSSSVDWTEEVCGETPILFSLSPDERNLCHFIFNALPRLFIQEFLPSKTPLLFGYSPSQFQKDFLKILGFDNQIIILPDADVVIPSVYFCTSPDPGWSSGEFIAWLRKKANLGRFLSESFPKRIYINRYDSQARILKNRDEVQQTALTYGFVSISLTNWPTDTQISFFVNAEVIICEQGAGASWLAFCSPGTVVLELAMDSQGLDHSGPAPHYWVLSSVVELNYQMVCGKRLSSNSYIVDCNRLEGLLSKH